MGLSQFFQDRYEPISITEVLTLDVIRACYDTGPLDLWLFVFIIARRSSLSLIVDQNSEHRWRRMDDTAGNWAKWISWDPWKRKMAGTEILNNAYFICFRQFLFGRSAKGGCEFQIRSNSRIDLGYVKNMFSHLEHVLLTAWPKFEIKYPNKLENLLKTYQKPLYQSNDSKTNKKSSQFLPDLFSWYARYSWQSWNI